MFEIKVGFYSSIVAHEERDHIIREVFFSVYIKKRGENKSMEREKIQLLKFKINI